MLEFKEDDVVEVILPRFQIVTEAGLAEALGKLGMTSVFKGSGFLDILSEGDHWVSRVQHNACVKVDEDGTEASAATATGVAWGIRRFVFNHPFFLIIRDDRSEAILFMGSIVDPAVD